MQLNKDHSKAEITGSQIKICKSEEDSKFKCCIETGKEFPIKKKDDEDCSKESCSIYKVSFPISESDNFKSTHKNLNLSKDHSLKTNDFQLEANSQHSNDQPMVIFKANYTAKYKPKYISTKNYKNRKHVVKIQKSFKCKRAKYHINKSLATYYNTVKKHNKDNYSSVNISQIVSRTAVLKKALAKENLLKEESKHFIEKDIPIFQNCHLEQITLTSNENKHPSQNNELCEKTSDNSDSLKDYKSDNSAIFKTLKEDSCLSFSSTVFEVSNHSQITLKSNKETLMSKSDSTSNRDTSIKIENQHILQNNNSTNILTPIMDTKEGSSFSNISSPFDQHDNPSQITLIYNEENQQDKSEISLRRNTNNTTINLFVSLNSKDSSNINSSSLTRASSLTPTNEDKLESLSYDSHPINSNLSADTLTQTNDNLLYKNSFATNVINSVLNSTTPITRTFKTNIINVGHAQIKNASILNYSKENSSITNDDVIKYDQNTSNIAKNEMEMVTIGQLDTPSASTKFISISDASNETLTEQNKHLGMSSDENFVIAKTSSYFNKTCDSNLTITASTLNCFSSQTTSAFDYLLTNKAYRKQLPNLTDSFNIPSDHAYSNIIVTDKQIKVFPTKDLSNAGGEVTRNVFKKSIDLRVTGNRLNNFTLPDEATIKEIITETERSQKKSCSEEFRSHMPFSELWDKLALFIELTMKRMEDALSERIIGEVTKSLKTYEKYVESISAIGDEFLKCKHLKSDNTKSLHDIELGIKQMEQNVQCDLVQNQIIDQLMLKLSMEGEKMSTECSSSNIFDTRKPNFKDIKYYLESHNSFEPTVSVEKKTKELILTPSAELRIKDFRVYQKLKLLLNGPIKFLRTNARVIGGVPMFFCAVFLIYGFIVLLLKMFS